ncbi:MAG: EAL domain-containing protein [Methylophaga sp.]|nr:EAL domain-containing protein [Methylophaga sp.]
MVITGHKNIYQLIIVFSAVAFMGVFITNAISSAGHDVTNKVDILMDEQIPLLDTLSSLHTNIKELDLTLYRYYETTESDLYLITWRNYQHNVSAILLELDDEFDIQQAQQYLADLSIIAASFDDEVQNNKRDWDKLRLRLDDFRKVSSQFHQLINDWGKQLHQEFKQHSGMTKLSISNMVTWQIAFNLFIFVIVIIIATVLKRQFSDRRINQELALFPEQNPHPILKLNSRGEAVYLNPAASKLMKTLGFSEQASKLLPNNYRQESRQLLDLTACFETKDYPLGDRVFSAAFHHVEGVNFSYAYLVDVTDRAKAEAELIYRANHDVLTQLPNRRRLEEVLDLKTENSFNPFSILSIKAGRLYLVNASLGHEMSDRLLKEMSSRLEQFITDNSDRDLDLFYFESGSWAIIYNHNASPAMAKQLGDEVNELFSTSLTIQSGEFNMPCTIGVTSYPQGGSSTKELMQNSDAALRQAYREGVNVRLYSENLTQDAIRWLDIEQGLKKAIDSNEFILNIQPKVYADTGRFAGGEVLLRWQHDDHWISPAEFIPVAEESGLIVAIGEWVLRMACSQWVSWSSKGMLPGRMAVNVSSQQFVRAGFVELVASILSETSMPASELELEITEEVASDNPEKLIKTMSRLKSLGVRLAIDDFGTGYSSLSYLRRFPIDTLKIDQSFVAKMDSNENDAAIVRMIMSLAKELNLEVVAEGVETEMQYQLLSELGCELIQGFYFYRPMDFDNYQQLLEQGE